MNKKNEALDYEEVKRRFYEKGLKLLTKEYKNNHQLLDCEDKDGYRYNTTILSLKDLNLTKKVYTLNKWSIYNINKYIENNNITSILLSEEYSGSKSLMRFRCECGNIYETCWSEFSSRRRYYCHNCALKYGTKRLKRDFIEKEFKKQGLDILPNQEYINNRQPLLCTTKDGYKIFKSYDALKKSYSKLIFSYTHNKANYVYNINNFLKLNRINAECIRLLDYKSGGHGQYYIEMRCECGEIYKSCIDYIKLGNYKCPKCAEMMSRGEQEVKRVLEKLNIDFIMQYQFPDCKYKKNLLFDFYLPEYNICIEYDGEQHFKKCSFQSQKDFEESIKRDKIKDDYCKNNNIRLIRIPYTKFKCIETLLITNLPLKE